MDGRVSAARYKHVTHLALARRELSLSGSSHCESEVNDIAVLDDVLLAFQPQLSFVASLAFAAGSDEVVVVNDFGPDESALEVAVDAAGSARRPVAATNGPSLHLVLADGEE